MERINAFLQIYDVISLAEILMPSILTSLFIRFGFLDKFSKKSTYSKEVLMLLTHAIFVSISIGLELSFESLSRSIGIHHYADYQFTFYREKFVSSLIWYLVLSTLIGAIASILFAVRKHAAIVKWAMIGLFVGWPVLVFNRKENARN